MKSKYILYIITLIALSIQYGCVEDSDLPSDMINAKIPEIITKDTLVKTASSVTVFAEVLKENGMPVTDYGAYWSLTSPVDTTKDQKISAGGSGTGEFEVTITGLEQNTQYFITPYAVNKKGIALGKELAVNTTSGAGVVTTLQAVDSTATTAFIGGKIIDKGEGEIKARGVYVSTKPGFTEPEMTIKSDMQTDSFVCEVTGLSPDTKYYFKAFVENTYTTFYGQEMSFTTTKGLPVVEGLTKISIDFYEAEFRAEVVSEGDSPVTERGFCWKEGEMPTIDDDTLVCLSGKGVFSGKIENLSQNMRYHVRAYAINSFGISYSNDTIFSPMSDSPTVMIHEDSIVKGIGNIKIVAEVLDEGLTSVEESGLCWSTTKSLPDTTDNKIALSSGRNIFEGLLENLTGNKTYYIRAYAKNELKTQYSDVYSFTTPVILVKKKALNEIRIQGTTRFCHSAQIGFLLGGDAGAEYTNELWRYDAVVDEWLVRQAYPEKNVSGQTPVYLNEKVYVFGGKKAGEPINSFYAYSTYRNEWDDLMTVSIGLPSPVTLSAGCVLDNNIYYLGGQHKSSISDDVWKFDPATNEWSNTGNLPEKQYGGIALVQDEMIYAGLGNISGSSINKKLWASSDGGNTWDEKANFPDNTSETIIGGVFYQNKLYVIDNQAQIWSYSPESDKWTKKSKLDVLEKSVHCIYVLENKIYIGLGSRSDQFYTYDPDWDN